MVKNKHRITVITIILVIGIIFVLSSCNQNNAGQEKQTEEISYNIETKDTTDNDTSDTATSDTTKQADNTEPEPEYVETPYPSGLTVEEKIAGYEVFEIAPGEYGVDIYDFVSENKSSLPSEFVVTFTHIPDFAAIVRAEIDENGYRDFWMEELYYKNTEVILGDKRYSFGVHSRIEYAENVVAVGFAGYHGRYCLLSQNTYSFFGYETQPLIDNPLVTYPRYLFYEEDGNLKYRATYLYDEPYAAMTQSAGELAYFIGKMSDLDLYFHYGGSVDYLNGKFTLTEEGGVTIGQKYDGYLQQDYEISFEYSQYTDMYELYPTFEEYMAAKEQGLLPEDLYYKYVER